MARTLQAARAETAATLRAQVEKVTAEPPSSSARDRLISRRELRGIPVAGPGVRGAIDGSVPGSDEHLEEFG